MNRYLYVDVYPYVYVKLYPYYISFKYTYMSKCKQMSILIGLKRIEINHVAYLNESYHELEICNKRKCVLSRTESCMSHTY